MSEADLQAARERKLRYRGTCEHCGRPTSGCNGREKAPKRCITCFNKLNAIWTEDAIINAIQTYAHRYGQPPSASHWNSTQAPSDVADRFHTDGDYPYTNSVIYRFGSWNKAIAAAGFETRGVGRPRNDPTCS